MKKYILISQWGNAHSWNEIDSIETTSIACTCGGKCPGVAHSVRISGEGRQTNLALLYSERSADVLRDHIIKQIELGARSVNVKWIIGDDTLYLQRYEGKAKANFQSAHGLEVRGWVN